jgi:hypothetical protein
MTNHLIWAAGLLGHLLLLCALFRRKHAATLPCFTLLIVFYLLRSIGLVAGQQLYGHPASVFVSLMLDLVDVVLQCAVLAELSWIALLPLGGKRRLTLPLLLVVSASLIVTRLAPHGPRSLAMLLVLAHFLLSVLMVEWAITLGFLLRPMGRSWRSPVAVISIGFGVYSTALLAGGGYFTTGREMRDYVFFSYLRIAVYLLVVLVWAVSLWVAKPESTVSTK